MSDYLQGTKPRVVLRELPDLLPMSVAACKRPCPHRSPGSVVQHVVLLIIILRNPIKGLPETAAAFPAQHLSTVGMGV